MSHFLNIARVIAPIFVAVFLGVLARRKALLSGDECRGLQKFVTKFALPCVLFNSCLTADIGGESLGTMALVLPAVIAASLWGFRARKKHFPYHNLPMLFSAQETGMLGIPLFMILFGADQAYRMGILDITQALVAFPVIAILSADTGGEFSLKAILRGVFTSPLMLMSFAGLLLNLTGAGRLLDSWGIGGILTDTTAFLAQPVSALMIFSVGFNFSLAEGNRGEILKIALSHFLMFAIFGGIIQLALFLVPSVDAMTRWAMLMYSTLPASYLAPGLGRSDKDATISSGVCSVLTVVSLLVFCIIAIAAA